ncbi:PAS domain-containing protein [Ligilactobacillus sp. WILCCON 0076]|uniref:PAS domain-containing protein n=1 Tax=Ligilactobacillus ubinensis TaxID=2876789 RepID=A0A9X2JL77_9LACO|nr:PAS domain-containing protein [Ligilactobacillus ubinensis]MCP0885781.1 PAS domain-containing protein [Ligilactobacillus ubinensis]
MVITDYIPFLKFLAEYLGDSTEIILHEIENNNGTYTSSIKYIGNNLSNRSLNSPSTDFILKIIHGKIYVDNDYMTNYKSKAMNGSILNATSFFIKDDNNQLIGMICLNHDNTKEQEVKAASINLAKLLNPTMTIDQNQILNDVSTSENLYIHDEDAIAQATLEIAGSLKQPKKLSKDQKLMIVKRLYNGHYFDLRDSIVKVADYFGMAQVSIYKYIQIIKKDNE